MKTRRLAVVPWLIFSCLPNVAQARVWTDATSQYTLDAELVASNDKLVVLQRADHELGVFRLEDLSNQDREFLKSQKATELTQASIGGMQTWKLRDGTKLVGRIVDYTSRDVTIQRRRGRIYVDDRVLDNLPEFYQQLVFRMVAHYKDLRQADRRAFEAWLVPLRGEPQTLLVDGVVFETQNGDEYSVPFFLMTDEDAKLLRPGWEKWLADHKTKNVAAESDHAFLLQSLAAAHQRDQQVKREIALAQLQLQAVQAGVTALWEVTLYPANNQGGQPHWLVVPGRDSRQASDNALKQFPGAIVGPVRRVSR